MTITFRRQAGAALFAAALALAVTPGRHERFADLVPSALAAPSAVDCEGTACSQVTLTFDEERQQYDARNNSADRWARVSASNLAATASACLAPNTSEHLVLKSVVGAYKADYAEPRCGEPDSYGSPPAGE